jgi:hypothetical protein
MAKAKGIKAEADRKVAFCAVCSFLAQKSLV